MRATDRELAKIVERQTRNLTVALRRAYMRAIKQLAAEIGESATLQAVQTLNVNAIATDAMIERAFLNIRVELRRGVESTMRESFADMQIEGRARELNAIKQAARRVGDVGGIRFDTLNPRLNEAVKTLSDTILPRFKQEIRETIREHIAQAVTNGDSLRKVVPQLREIIGLAPSHVTHVDNFRKRLETIHTQRSYPKALTYGLRDRRYDNTLWNAMQQRTPLSREQISTMTKAYRDKYKTWHANTIARTAAVHAQREGQKASILSAVDSGLMPADRMRKRWVSVLDDRVRDEHKAMNGETVALGAKFSNGLDVPSEYNCRCFIAYELQPVVNVERPARAGAA